MTLDFDLEDRIDQRTREIEDLYKRELMNLSESLKKHAASELSTITNDMEREVKNIRGALEETKNIRSGIYLMASEIKTAYETVLNLNKAQSEQYWTELRGQNEKFLKAVKTREVRRSWIFRIAMVLMIVGGIWGFSEYMGGKIVQQQETMKALKAQTEELEKLHIGVRREGDRVFLTLPKGMKAKEEWKLGDRNAIELEEG